MRNFFITSAAVAGLLAGAAAPNLVNAQAPGYAGPPIGRDGLPGGTWTTVCRAGSLNGGVLSAECKDIRGDWRATSLSLQNCRGDIGDQDGALACGNGPKGTVGPVLSNRQDRRDNGGGAAASFLAGALLGGALAGNAGAPPPPAPPPPPAYGDPRYGDPHYDWRYQQGGYGYGHRPGEWIPIGQRADWLNGQIDRLLRDGRIDYRDARDYRRQLGDIQYRESSLMRQGRFGPRERDDLDHQFNDLAEQIRHDARED